MAGFVVERNGYTTVSKLIADVVEDLLDNGFTKIFPTNAFNPDTAGDVFKVSLEASETVDQLAASQPWRITFDVKGVQQCGVYLGTPLQIDTSGSVATLKDGQGQADDIIGAVGAQTDGLSIKPDTPDMGFVNRSARVGTTPGAGGSYPMSYRICISPRGVFVGVWEDATTTENSTAFNWFLVQRPVDRDTGAVLVEGKAPVICLNGVNGKYWQFVVREADILKPGRRRPADTHTPDSEAIINAQPQVALAEDGKYIVTFPSRLNTSRYRYPHELDMVGITSADVVSQYSDVPLTVYGEGQARIYHAMQGNALNNTGMRVLLLDSGGGI